MKDNKGHKYLWKNDKKNRLLALWDIQMMFLLQQSRIFPMLPRCTNVSSATTNRWEIPPFTLSVIASVTGDSCTFEVLELNYLFVYLETTKTPHSFEE